MRCSSVYCTPNSNIPVHLGDHATENRATLHSLGRCGDHAAGGPAASHPLGAVHGGHVCGGRAVSRVAEPGAVGMGGQGGRKWAGDACRQAGRWLSAVGVLSRSCGWDKGASPAWLGAHHCSFCRCQVDGSTEGAGLCCTHMSACSWCCLPALGPGFAMRPAPHLLHAGNAALPARAAAAGRAHALGRGLPPQAALVALHL